MRKYLNSSTPSNTDSKTATANSAIPTPIQPTATSKPLNGQTCQIKLEPCTQNSQEIPPNPTCPKPLVPTEAGTTPPLPSDPPILRSEEEYDHAQEIRVAPKNRKEGKGRVSSGGKKRICRNAGTPKTEKIISAILVMKRNGFSNYRIAKELSISHATVAKYIKVDAVTPQAYQHSVLPSLSQDGTDYDINKSLCAILGLNNQLKLHALRLAQQGDMPNQITPLMVKQMAETDRLVLTLPQDLNKGRQDLYEMIHNRRLDANDDEVSELGQAGEMGS
jgi:hypothetical protein